MRIVRAAGLSLPPLAAAIGNFDGLHAGHRLVLERMFDAAAGSGLARAVVTFEPHPVELLRPEQAPVRIDDFRTKMDKLRRSGVEYAIVLRFDRRLASLSSAGFEQLLAGRLNVRRVVVGSDFRYGQGRAGSVASLRQRAGDLALEVVSDLAGADGRRVSSGLVRELLAAGEFGAAASLLGGAYRLQGRVGVGARLGRRLGFPTANICRRQPSPLAGVYAAWADVGDRIRRPAALSVGCRQAAGGGDRPVIEVHLIDYQADLYGRRIAVEPVALLRSQRDYPDLDALAEAIGQDVQRCREMLASPPE